MSTYADLLADPGANIAILVVVSGLNLVSGLVETFYFCDSGLSNSPLKSAFVTEPSDSLPNTTFENRIQSALVTQSSIAQNDQFGGQSFPAYGPWQFDNSDGATATISGYSSTPGSALVFTQNPHTWQPGDEISIRGCAQSNYNVTKVRIQQVFPGNNSFSFQAPLPLGTTSAAPGATMTAYSGLDGWRTLSFDGQSLKAYIVGTLSNGQTVGWNAAGNPFNGTIKGDAVVDESKAVLNARDISFLFSKNVQTNLYAGMNGALSMNGKTQYITMPSYTSLPDKTFEIRFRCKGNNTAVSNQVIAMHGSGFSVPGLDWHVQINTVGNLGIFVQNGSSTQLAFITTGHDYRDSVWHQAALTVSSVTGLATGFIDGNIINTSLSTPTFTAQTGILYVGSASGTIDFFNGEVDEIRFWNSALSQNEIQQNMIRERVADLRMRGYWQLDDNIGANLFDTSGNGGTGVLRPRATLTGPAGIVASTAAISVLSTDDSFNRLSGNFLVDGFLAGQSVTSSGFVNTGNNTTFSIATVTALKITTATTLVTEPVPGPSWTYSGEGYSDLTGKQKPYAVGQILEFAPTLVDPGRLIYQAHDGAIASIPWVWDNTGPLTPGLQWSIIDYARGLFQLLIQPQGNVTCSVIPLTNVFKTCILYDGATGFSSASSVSYHAGSMSLECLIRANSIPLSGTMTAFGFQSGTAAGTRKITCVNGLPSALVRNDVGTSFTVSGPSLLSLNTWYWLAMSLDTVASVLSLYVNGVIVASMPVTGTFNTTINTCYFGRNDTTQWWSGEVDECRIWNFPITSTNILNNMMKQLSGTESGLTQYWSFNENTGTSSANGVSGQPSASLNGPAVITASSGSISTAYFDSSFNRSTGSFLTDGFVVGQLLTTYGFANTTNNVLLARIVSVSSSKIKINPTLPMVDEAAATGQTLIGRAGASWAISRQSRSDLAYSLMTQSLNAPFTTSQLYLQSFIQFNIDDSSDNGFLCEEGKATTFLDVLDNLINWDGLYGATRAGLIQVSRFNPPAGIASSGDFDFNSIMGDLVPTSQPIPFYGVVVNWGQNYSVSSATDVIGIIQTNSSRYSFATNPWRTAPSGGVSPTASYPNGLLLVVNSTLNKLSDAQNLADRLYSIYSVRHDFYEVPLTVTPLAIDINQEITLTLNRLGLDSTVFFRVVGFTENGDLKQVSVKVWR